MDNTTKKMLAEKNEKLINMVIERVRRDFLDDIVLIGLTGSFLHGDYYEKSDLDLCIVHNSVRFGKLWDTFIFDDVGYSFAYISWDNLERKAALERVGVSGLTDTQIIYCSKPEYLEKFNRLKEKALNLMAKPIDNESIARAKKHFDLAKQEYANVMLSDKLGTVRYASSRIVFNLVNTLVSLNNTCIKRGIKRYLEEVLTYKHLPENFYNEYMSVIEAKTVNEIKNASLSLLSGVNHLYDAMCQQFIPKPVPTINSLADSYEHLWGSSRHKVMVSAASNNKSYAYHAARDAQGFLNEMADSIGTKKLDIMQHFDVDKPEIFADAYVKALDEYVQEYEKVGRPVLKFDTFEALYDYCINNPFLTKAED